MNKQEDTWAKPLPWTESLALPGLPMAIHLRQRMSMTRPWQRTSRLPSSWRDATCPCSILAWSMDSQITQGLLRSSSRRHWTLHLRIHLSCMNWGLCPFVIKSEYIDLDVLVYIYLFLITDSSWVAYFFISILSQEVVSSDMVIDPVKFLTATIFVYEEKKLINQRHTDPQKHSYNKEIIFIKYTSYRIFPAI